MSRILLDDLLADARPIDLFQHVGENEGSDAGFARDAGAVNVVAASLSIQRRRLGAGEVVTHVHEHVAAPGEFDDVVGRPFDDGCWSHAAAMTAQLSDISGNGDD